MLKPSWEGPAVSSSPESVSDDLSATICANASTGWSAIICGHHCDNKGHMHTVLHVVTFVLFACSFLFSNGYCSSFPAGLLILLHTTHGFDFWSWRCTQKGRRDQMMQVSFVSQPPLTPHSESTAQTLRSHKPRPTSKVDLYSDALQSTYNVLQKTEDTLPVMYCFVFSILIIYLNFHTIWICTISGDHFQYWRLRGFCL